MSLAMPGWRGLGRDHYMVYSNGRRAERRLRFLEFGGAGSPPAGKASVGDRRLTGQVARVAGLQLLRNKEL
jgi:hypothetical protein